MCKSDKTKHILAMMEPCSSPCKALMFIGLLANSDFIFVFIFSMISIAFSIGLMTSCHYQIMGENSDFSLGNNGDSLQQMRESTCGGDDRFSDILFFKIALGTTTLRKRGSKDEFT